MADYKIADMPAVFGVRIDFSEVKALSAESAKKAVLQAIEAMPAARFSKFNNGKLTLVL
jgi:hypothetical protein